VVVHVDAVRSGRRPRSPSPSPSPIAPTSTPTPTAGLGLDSQPEQCAADGDDGGV